MDVSQAIQTRRSVRAFLDQPVEEEKILQILEAARLSPSASNRQSWKFVVVRDADLRAKLGEAAGNQHFVGQAPVILVACGTEPASIMRCGQYRYTVDVSIATAYMLLEAREVGLGTCWIGNFDEKKVKEILGIPEAVRVVALSPLGYAAREATPVARKGLDEIACWETYG